MRKKIHNHHSHLLQAAFPSGYWTQDTCKKQIPLNYSRANALTRNFLNNSLRRTHPFTGLWPSHKTLAKIVGKIDTLLAAMTIGLMLLSGIWLFLIELAKF